MSRREENARKIPYFVHSLGHFLLNLTSRQTKSDTGLIGVEILDSIFINYIIRSKQGEFSHSHCRSALRYGTCFPPGECMHGEQLQNTALQNTATPLPGAAAPPFQWGGELYS